MPDLTAYIELKSFSAGAPSHLETSYIRLLTGLVVTGSKGTGELLVRSDAMGHHGIIQQMTVALLGAGLGRGVRFPPVPC